MRLLSTVFVSLACLVTIGCSSTIKVEDLAEYEFMYSEEETDSGESLNFRNLEFPDKTFVNCEDYLSRTESSGFCSSEPPKEWQSLEFNGRRYFVIPLAAIADQSMHFPIADNAAPP
jgi:hypothetical protein